MQASSNQIDSEPDPTTDRDAPGSPGDPGHDDPPKRRRGRGSAAAPRAEARASATAGRETAGHETVGPDDRPLRLEDWLPFRLFTVSARVADVLAGFYGPRYGLSRAAWRTMAIVANRQGISAKEICQAGGLDQFAVSRAIGQLVEFGYARRNAGRSDKRYASIALTAQGWAVFEEISTLAKRIEAELTAQVTERERAALDTVLHKLDTASAGILARGWHVFAPERDDGPDEASPSAGREPAADGG